VVVVVATEPGVSVGVGLVSGALLASAGFVWPGAAPFVGCCCWHVYCWPDYWSGCSSCSPSKKCVGEGMYKYFRIKLYPKTICYDF
jgi:hypothetical protein